MSVKPEKLVTISYRKDGKTYLLSIPSEHAEWAEEMLSLDRAEVERNAAERALTDAADDYLRDSYEIPRVSDWLRARAEAYRREGKEGTNVDMDV